MGHNDIINEMIMRMEEQKIQKITHLLIHVISETNGISLNDTLELLTFSPDLKEDKFIEKSILEFRKFLWGFQQGEVDIDTLLTHPVAMAFFKFFKNFPLPFYEDHIHLTGSLSADFIYPHLKRLLHGPHKEIYEKRIAEVYGKNALPINSKEDVDHLIRLKDGEKFHTYLKILFLPKLILNSKKIHKEATYHMARELHSKYNIGNIRLKFTLSRINELPSEKIPSPEKTTLTAEDVVLGLYEGFEKFKREHPSFNFVLSPCFRKEANFYDSKNFSSKSEHFKTQVDKILALLEKHPQLKSCLSEVDTVGDERELYRKSHFEEMKTGLRKLQYNGLKIRSHHGETWKILRKGVQSVDNAMNIWHVDTLEHGLSLGINPNFYFHRIFQTVMKKNKRKEAIPKGSLEYLELNDMDWFDPQVKDKIFKGEKLTRKDEINFLKTKFHNAREIEYYQHDVLNRMMDKGVSLISLPSSNLKLTGSFSNCKDHPFSWWEKKGVDLGVGTDNYITLNTNYIKEMLILLFSDAENLKITKLLMVATREQRRPLISNLLWEMRERPLPQTPLKKEKT